MSRYDDGPERDRVPAALPAALERALAAETSLPARLRHLGVGLAGGCGATLLAVLWATEPEPLPARTRAAFAGLIAVGLAWAAFAAWALTRRRPLYARDRVLAAGLALAAATAGGAAATALAAARAGAAAAVTTALVLAVPVTVAVLLLARARARRRALLRLRESLRREALHRETLRGDPGGRVSSNVPQPIPPTKESP
ncbi:transmembrane transport protein [Kitasatospora sp. NPDC004240]